MAMTYQLIEGRTLGSNANSVTFSSIPQTYTDLVLRFSFRDNYSGYTTIFLRVNGITTATYANRYFTADGSTVSAGSVANNNTVEWFSNNNTNSTAATRCNGEIYFGSYTTSAQKPIWIENVAEDNVVNSGRTTANANLAYTTNAINSFVIYSSVLDFLAGSQFYLYGIKNF